MFINKNEAMDSVKANLAKAMKSGTEEEQANALNEYMDAFQADVTKRIANQVSATSADNAVLATRGQNVLTSKERKFFSEVIDKKGFDNADILPVTTQERIFEDLNKEHPLLRALGLRDMGAVTRIITAKPEFAYKWGKLFGDIRGQVGTAFEEVLITTNKLTAFAVIPDDILILGPEWVERYVRAIVVESISIGLEQGFLNGGGAAQNEPVGLLKNVDADSGAVTDKPAETKKLTFKSGKDAVREMASVMKALSSDEKGDTRQVAGKVVMVINPLDHYDILTATMVQNVNGAYVANVPFNPEIVESNLMESGKVLFFVKGQYIAATAGGYKLERFNETLAMEDAILYTIKQFAHGMPLDNNAARLYEIDTTEAPEGV